MQTTRPAEQSKLYKYCRQHNINPADIPSIMASMNVTPVIGKDRISNFASGQSELYTGALLRLCKALCCTPNDIMDYEEFCK